jgi:hypothetical protein
MRGKMTKKMKALDETIREIQMDYCGTTQPERPRAQLMSAITAYESSYLALGKALHRFCAASPAWRPEITNIASTLAVPRQMALDIWDDYERITFPPLGIKPDGSDLTGAPALALPLLRLDLAAEVDTHGIRRRQLAEAIHTVAGEADMVTDMTGEIATTLNLMASTLFNLVDAYAGIPSHG